MLCLNYDVDSAVAFVSSDSSPRNLTTSRPTLVLHFRPIPNGSSELDGCFLVVPWERGGPLSFS